MDLALVVATGMLAYGTDAVLVGLGLALYRSRTGRGQLGFATVGVLFLLFVLLDLYPFPALAALDATLHVGNPSLASLFEVDRDLPLTDFFQVGFFDALVWAAQVALAAWVAARFAAPPPDASTSSDF